MPVLNTVVRMFPLGAFCLALLAGCHGSGEVRVVALNYRSIDPPAPRVGHVTLDHCYWWIDRSNQVWVAMETEKPVLLGIQQFVFQLSFVLEQPPAGRARNYLVANREMRAIARLGPAEGRYVSLHGIVALYRERNDRLRGSFRLEVAREISQMLGGWGRPSRHLMLGTFTAVLNEEQGRRIAAETETLGWERKPPPPRAPTTQPALSSQPARRRYPELPPAVIPESPLPSSRTSPHRHPERSEGSARAVERSRRWRGQVPRSLRSLGMTVARNPAA